MYRSVIARAWSDRHLRRQAKDFLSRGRSRQQGGLAARRSDELQADWQAGSRESARDRDRRTARQSDRSDDEEPVDLVVKSLVTDPLHIADVHVERRYDGNRTGQDVFGLKPLRDALSQASTLDLSAPDLRRR